MEQVQSSPHRPTNPLTNMRLGVVVVVGGGVDSFTGGWCKESTRDQYSVTSSDS